MHLSRVIVFALTALTVSSSVFAQDPDRASFLPDVIKTVMLDPTTYAPTVVAWEATRLDWRSSQIFFQHGLFEHNPRFTVSGLGNDTAISYGAGNRQILADAMANLQVSLLNNVTDRIIERALLRGHPEHPTLVRAIGWIERSAVASYVSYRQSAGHFRQWQENERRALELGYR
jgi:hypothetical protein